MSKDNQHERMIRELKKNKLRGVPNYRWPQMGILSYTKRISELRSDGHMISSIRQRLKNGRATNVWQYYLIEDTDGKLDDVKLRYEDMPE